MFVIIADSGNHQKSNISTESRGPHQRSPKKTANWNLLSLWKNKQRNRHNRNTNPLINQPKPRNPKFILFQSALPSFQILQDSNFLLISLIPNQKLPRIVIFLSQSYIFYTIPKKEKKIKYQQNSKQIKWLYTKSETPNPNSQLVIIKNAQNDSAGTDLQERIESLTYEIIWHQLER